MSGIKVTAADRYFSLCVRERAGWRCERCGKQYQPGEGTGTRSGLDCSHYKGRGNWAVRFEPLNAEALCYGCHSYFEANPDEYREWKLKQLGQEKYDVLIELAERSNGRGKLYKRHHRTGALTKYYRSIYQAMLHVRSLGCVERIEFVAYV